jgi:hypothetical protein
MLICISINENHHEKICRFDKSHIFIDKGQIMVTKIFYLTIQSFYSVFLVCFISFINRIEIAPNTTTTMPNMIQTICLLKN